MERQQLNWMAPEFEYREKSVSWYWTSIIIAVVILGISVWMHNFLFSVFVIIAEILVMVWGDKKPREIGFVLDDKGLTVDGKKFYPYSDIASFSMGEETADGWRDIAFRFGHGMRPLLKAMISSGRTEEIENFLLRSVKKTDYEESFIDSLQKLTGF